MKECSNCKDNKPFLSFAKDSSRKDGFYHMCKKCHRNYRQSKTQKETISRYWKEHYIAHKSKYRAKAGKRRAAKLQATPKWLTTKQLLAIECKYSVVEMLSKHGTQKYAVDHIVPLQGKTVCGLHVPWNLQVITELDNMKKGNRFNGEKLTAAL
jgi:hypothetical protein